VVGISLKIANRQIEADTAATLLNLANRMFRLDIIPVIT
jgi:hypothetical protein